MLAASFPKPLKLSGGFSAFKGIWTIFPLKLSGFAKPPFSGIGSPSAFIIAHSSSKTNHAFQELRAND